MTTIPNMAGKGMTVRGPINPSEIGSTLMHEHVLVDFKIYNEPSFHTPASEMALWDQKVAPDNLHLARESKPLRDNLLYADERLATDEAVYFRDAGGNTIVDVANNGIRRDPLGLRRSSYAAGVNIVMSCGRYHFWYHPQDMDQRTVEDMTDEIIRDITVGVGETGIRSGIIGEVGIDGDPITPDEIKSIKAAARASKATGAAISFHRSGVGKDEQLQVVGAVAEEGADLTRTILGHSDFIAMDMPLMKELLELVVQHVCIEGYSDLSLMRASSVVKRQFTRTASRLRLFCHASTSPRRVSLSGMRRSRHCRASTPISFSAIFSQLPCLGV